MDEKMKAIYIVSIIALLSAIMVMPAAATTWDVYEGDSIQAVLNNASDGDTVFVHAGTYVIPKYTDPLRPFGLILGCENCILKGEGADVVTLDGNGQLAIVVGDGSIPYSGCIVEGLKITNASTGVATFTSPNCIIRDNVFEAMNISPFNTFAPNTTFMGNVINGSPGVKPNDQGHSLALFMDNVISNTTCNWYAVRFKGSSFIVADNTLINNAGGLGLYTDATDITVTRNTIRSGGAGIKLYKTGSGNKIYLNDIVDNTESVKISSTTASQFWNSTEPIEYTYNGSTYTNYLGNYWSDYSGVDTSPHDGVGDTPYDIPGSAADKDHRPLMAGYENYHVKAPAPPTPLTPQTPFLISGEVSYEDGTPVLNPVVTVKKTGENFTVKTSASSNLYLTLTDSTHVSVGDGIIVNASDGTVYNETEHNVTEEDMNSGGFVQDTLLETAGTCGDVNEDGAVDFMDVGLVARHWLYGDALADEWAADVNGDCSIDFMDVGLIARHWLYGDELNCK